ncbi:MAG: hypothetical protein OEV44_03975 [Spirochaetota bacterium]|nr:hypothetical protein [Spirochaetota bacterium]
MRKLRFIIIFQLFVLLFFNWVGVTSEKKTIYGFVDGSGNIYIIDSIYIEYKPVEKHMSSSGLYSGGKYVKKKLKTEEYDKIISNINIAINNKTIHIKNRVKGSGLIIVEKELTKQAYIINGRSKENIIINELLKKIINNSQ